MAATQDQPYTVFAGTEGLLQGDILENVVCPVVESDPDTPLRKGSKPTVVLIENHVAILTQSCDIVNAKLLWILVCPVFPLIKVGGKDKQTSAKKGHSRGLYVLPEAPAGGALAGELVADFRTVYILRKSWLAKHASTLGFRLRLNSPFREGFSHALGNFFSTPALQTVSDPPEG